MRSAKCVTVLALLSSLFVRAATAQDAAAWRDSAQRLHVAEQALRDSMVGSDTTSEEIARQGHLVIAASPNDRALAAPALRRFVVATNRWFGDAMPSPAGFRIVIRTETGFFGAWRATRRNVGQIVLAGIPDADGSTRLQRTVAPGDVDKTLADAYGEMMITSVPAIALWLHFTPQITAAEDQRRQVAMYALATGTGAVQRGCTAGNPSECAYALELRPAPPGTSAPQFALSMRADLLFTALEIGGPGAWSRLRVEADSGVATALAAAAGMPLDSLLMRWRGQLLALRPTTGPLSAPIGVAALVWSVVLLLGALGASKWA